MDEQQQTLQQPQQAGQLSKKERRALKRQEKQQEQTKEVVKKKAGKFGRWIFWAVIVVLIGGGIYYFSKGEEPTGEDMSISYPILEATHVARPTTVTDYNSNPPTSGKHWSDANAPASRGVHDEELPDEVLVHNLEHGEIWISYKPDIPNSVKEELRKITGDSYKVVLTVRSKNDSDIAVAGWGRLDKFNLDGKPLDAKRIEDFINRYRNQGPELIP